MLILIAVTVTTAIKGGLFEKTKQAIVFYVQDPPKNIGKDNKILSLHIKMWDFWGKGMFFFVLLFNSTNFALQLRVKR